MALTSGNSSFDRREQFASHYTHISTAGCIDANITIYINISTYIYAGISNYINNILKVDRIKCGSTRIYFI